jgi:hypothetical protein
MTTFETYFGIYYFMGIVLDVQQIEGQLTAAIPGVPDGFEIILEPVGEDRFRTRGGPIDGSVVIFVRNDAGEVTAMRAGSFVFSKITPADLPGLQVVERHPAPEYERTPEKCDQFERLFQQHLARSDGSWIDYDLPYPKYEYIQYLSEKDVFIFHGSNNDGIDVFQPVRKSFELRDETGRGNVAGVYGTHDGLWAMFFAVIDRDRLKGSIRNGVMYFQDRAGEQLAVYNFSINQDQLSDPPVREGAFYLLPKESFERLKLTEDSYTNEWVSESAVKPFAKLRLQPDDFPFLDQIGGHDDSELIRLGTISGEIRSAAVFASLEGGRFEVEVPSDAQVTERLDEYISLQRVMIPGAKFEIEQSENLVKLIISSLPPAMEQIIRDMYTDLLKKE